MSGHLQSVGIGQVSVPFTDLQSALDRQRDLAKKVEIRYQMAALYEADPKVRISQGASAVWANIAHEERYLGNLERSISATAANVYIWRQLNEPQNGYLATLLSRACIYSLADPDRDRADHFFNIATLELSTLHQPQQMTFSVHWAAREAMSLSAKEALATPPLDLDHRIVANELYGLSQGLNQIPPRNKQYRNDLITASGIRAAELYEALGEFNLAFHSLGYAEVGLVAAKGWEELKRVSENRLALGKTAGVPLESARLSLARAATNLEDLAAFDAQMAALRTDPPTRPVNQCFYAFMESEGALVLRRNSALAASIADRHVPSVAELAGVDLVAGLRPEAKYDTSGPILFLAFLLHNRIAMKGASERQRMADARTAIGIYLLVIDEATRVGDISERANYISNIRKLLRTFSSFTYTGASVALLRDYVVSDVKGTVEDELVTAFWEIAIESGQAVAEVSINAASSLISGWSG